MLCSTVGSMMMPKYNVVGEYGPMSDQSIAMIIEAESASQAKDIFCEYVKETFPVEWERMGRHNVNVYSS